MYNLFHWICAPKAQLSWHVQNCEAIPSSYFLSEQNISSKIWIMSYRNWYWDPGPWFNIKKSSYQYRKSHYGDETILRPSYLHNGISYSGKTTSLYWIRAQVRMVSPVTWESHHIPGGVASPMIREFHYTLEQSGIFSDSGISPHP